MRPFSPLWALLLLAAPLSLAHGAAPTVDGLRQDALQSAFQVLRRDYIRQEELTMDQLNRAALAGLLSRLHYGARLVPVAKEKAKATPYVHAEFLAPNVFYLRPESLGEGESVLFEKALRDGVERQSRRPALALQGESVSDGAVVPVKMTLPRGNDAPPLRIILDLRGGPGEGLFEEAAAILECFVPSGEVMFKLKQLGGQEAELFVSRKEPVWTGSVVVLVDHDTNNASEAVAAVLRQKGRAFLIGEPTRGAAVRYSEVQLDADVALRYASSEVVLADGSELFEHGLTPNDPVPAVAEQKRQVFAQSREHSMKPFVQDQVRPRYNERALVMDTNPELDDMVRLGQGKPLPFDRGQLRDVVTQRAIDLLEGRDFMSEGKLEWKTNTAKVGTGAGPGERKTTLSTPAAAPMPQGAATSTSTSSSAASPEKQP